MNGGFVGQAYDFHELHAVLCALIWMCYVSLRDEFSGHPLAVCSLWVCDVFVDGKVKCGSSNLYIKFVMMP